MHFYQLFLIIIDDLNILNLLFLKILIDYKSCIFIIEYIVNIIEITLQLNQSNSCHSFLKDTPLLSI